MLFFLIVCGAVLLCGGLFGIAMQLSGEDSNAIYSSLVMFVFGFFFLYAGYKDMPDTKK